MVRSFHGRFHFDANSVVCGLKELGERLSTVTVELLLFQTTEQHRGCPSNASWGILRQPVEWWHGSHACSWDRSPLQRHNPHQWVSCTVASRKDHDHTCWEILQLLETLLCAYNKLFKKQNRRKWKNTCSLDTTLSIWTESRHSLQWKDDTFRPICEWCLWKEVHLWSVRRGSTSSAWIGKNPNPLECNLCLVLLSTSSPMQRTLHCPNGSTLQTQERKERFFTP